MMIPAGPLDSLGHNYRVVYDAGAHFPFEWVLLIPVFMFCVGLGGTIYYFRHGGANKGDKLRRWFFLAWTFGTGLLAVRLLGDSYNTFVYYRDSLRAGRVAVVEGIVTHFDPQPPEGHHDESFDVSGHHFSYSSYVMNAGFNHSKGAGGPMRDGLQVRIAYLDGKILRLEIADQ
jgi:hypothetical protein